MHRGEVELLCSDLPLVSHSTEILCAFEHAWKRFQEGLLRKDSLTPNVLP